MLSITRHLILQNFVRNIWRILQMICLKFIWIRSKDLLNLLRDGLSLDIVDFLENPSSYELKKVSTSSSSETIPPETDSNNSTSIKTSSSSSASNKSSSINTSSSSSSSKGSSWINSSPGVLELREVPHNLREAMQLDCLVKIILGDGSCLFNAAAQWILGGFEKAKELWMEAHLFMIQNWDYYSSFIRMPFTERIRVWPKSYDKTIETYPDMRRFLLSDESLLCYSNRSLDLSNIAIISILLSSPTVTVVQLFQIGLGYILTLR